MTREVRMVARALWHPPLLLDGVPCDCESYEPCAGECCGRGHCTCDPAVYAAAAAQVRGRPEPVQEEVCGYRACQRARRCLADPTETDGQPEFDTCLPAGWLE